MKVIGALKGVVIGMGFLIVAGLGAVATGLYIKAGGEGVRPFAAAPGPAAQSSPARPFGDVAVPLPAGCTIVEIKPHGERLYIRTGPAGSCARVIVFDVAGGRVLGTIAVTP